MRTWKPNTLVAIPLKGRKCWNQQAVAALRLPVLRFLYFFNSTSVPTKIHSRLIDRWVSGVSFEKSRLRVSVWCVSRLA